MAVEDVFYYRASNYAALKALVGDRISPLMLRQNTELPAVTYQRITGIPEHAMGSDPGIVTSVLQVDCWGDGNFGAEGYGSVKSVATQVKAAWSRYSQAAGSGVTGTQIDDVFLDDEQDFYEPSTEMLRVMLEFTVYHRT